MKRIILSIALMMAVLSLSAQQANTQEDKGFEIAKNLEIFANIYKNVHLNYVDDVEPGKLMKTAIDAMLASLDPYTNYYPESSMEDVKLQLLGEYGGMGALIHQNGKNIYIAEPYKGLPADKAGLMAGDQILEVNGQSTEGKTTADVSALLRGQSGTPITIKVKRANKTFEKSINREEIKLPNVPYSGMVEGNVGYIKLNEFTQDAAKNVKEAFRKLKSEHPDMKGLILDLRNNGGGLMNEAVDIVNIFVKQGELVVETKGKVASKNLKSYTKSSPSDTEIPLAVLINGYSASASEIVSGSLQDLDRAVILGQRSFGKGLVQNILPLTYNAQMKVTVSKYFIPSGRCIQAIDYSSRDENGKAQKVPDSLKTAFQTRNGRTVYDGFGIEPDVEIEPQYMSMLALTLVQKFLVFDYATQYRRQHASISDPSTFEISDEMFEDFKKFISNKDYDYKTPTETYLEGLREIAKEDQFQEALENEIKALEEKLKAEKADALNKYRQEICELLKSEIVVRYYYDEGRTQSILKSDPEVKKAVEVITNKPEYRKLLGYK